MALETSILKSTKKILGLSDENTAFDQDVITHINAVFFSLYQLGIGPDDGFAIQDDSEEWEAFVGDDTSVPAFNAIQSYVYLRVRLLFDPPGTPHHISAMKDQITEFEYRLKMDHELKNARPGPVESLPI